MATRYWIITTSPANMGRTAGHGWRVQGFKTRQRKNVMERMRPGDRLKNPAQIDAG